MQQLAPNQLTLNPYKEHRHDIFESLDDRDVVTFAEEPPHPLPDEWMMLPAIAKDGRLLMVRVRSADCGLRCRCAGEYDVVTQ